MGSKGSGAPAPDPRLVEAQIKSMGIQDDAINKVLQNSADLAPLQKEQMEFGLQTAKTAYDQSQADRTYALGRRGVLTGLQDTAVDDAKKFNEPGRQEQLAHEAQGDVSSAFSAARGQNTRAMERMGVSPGSGKFAAMGNEMAMTEAAALASASNKTRQSARAEKYALNDRASNALAGYPAMSMTASGAGAGTGTIGVDLANRGVSGLNSGFTTAGTMAGQMGSNASSMYGTMGNYRANMAQSEGQGLGAVLGVGATLATKFL